MDYKPMNLREYYLDDVGQTLTCYLTRDGTLKLKISTGSSDLIVGVARADGFMPMAPAPEPMPRLSPVGSAGRAPDTGREWAMGLCDTIFQAHDEFRTRYKRTNPLPGTGSQENYDDRTPRAADYILYLASHSYGMPALDGACAGKVHNRIKDFLEYAVLPLHSR